jgi:eukaryotic-like serine/threonine-protein kinase
MTCPACGAGTSEGHSTCPSCGRRLKVPREVATGLLTPVPKTTDPGTTILPPSESATNAGIASSDPDATRIGSPVSRPLESEDVTRLGTEQQGFDTGVTRLGTPDEDDVTRVGTGPEEFDADVTQLGTPPEDVTRIATPEDDATQYVPSEEDLTVYVAPEDDATFVGTARPEDDATYIAPPRPPTNRPPTARPATTPSRPPTSQVRPPSTLRRPPSTGGLRSKSGVRASGKDGPLDVGQGFGERYQILKVLGVGGMGAVYQAFDQELGVAVALKVIRPEIAADPRAADEIERRFKRELLLARQVTHKNVVRIHDLGDIDGIKYITMPYVHGSDLATILAKDNNLPVPRALRIARGIVSGLVAAHGAGVVHRDLKPANIMVADDDEPTIMDFGIARSSGGAALGPVPKRDLSPTELSRGSALLASQTMAGAIVGTVEYMAPEQARGETVDQRADIYAVGLILYDMLIGGRRSKRAASAVAELEARMTKAPPAPRTVKAEIPVAVDAIISRCLEPDPGKRFQTTAELQAAFDKLDADGKPLPIYRRVSRRTMIAAAVVVLLLLGGTFYAAKWLTAPVKEPDPITVVIADVQNNTGDPTFNSALSQTLRRALEGASFITAYDRARVQNLGIRPPEKLDDVAARELALKQGLGVVLAGSIDPRGNAYAISVKALHPVTGEVITSARRVASSKNDVLDAATQLAVSVRKALGDRTSQSDQLFAMRTVSASSLDVVSHYAAGVEAQARGQYEEARKSLLRAVELDPDFGLGYQGLAAMAATLGQREEAQKYIQEALRHVDGLTERERFFTRGAYYRQMGDYRNCAKEYGELLSRYSADSAARVQRAACLVFLRNPREALAETQQALKMLPNHAAFRLNLVLTAYRSGDFQLVEDEVKAMAQPEPRAVLALAYSQMGRGLPAEATETFKKAAAMDSRGWGQSGIADVLVYQGRYSEATSLLEEAAAADLAAKNPLRAAIRYVSAGSAHLLRGNTGRAAAAADTALQHSTAMPVKFLAAQIFVETGDVEKAAKLAAELAASTQPSDDARVHGKIIEAQIALKKHEPRQAITILTDANKVLDTWIGHFTLGRTYLEAGMFVQADSEFDLCITRRGEALTMMDEGPSYGVFPPVYYYQGRVREELKTASFADSYRQYLKIRGESKEDPLVPEVRKRGGN